MATTDELEAAGVKMLSLKDIRSFGQFSGMEGDWSSWSFAFEAATGSIGWGSAITSSVTHDTDISFTALSRVNQSIAKNLYTLLALTCKGKALSIIKLCPEGNGLEAVRRLYHEYRPRGDEHTRHADVQRAAEVVATDSSQRKTFR